MKYFLALTVFCFFVQVELLPTPRHRIQPNWENYEIEYQNRGDKSLTYERYIDEWVKVVRDEWTKAMPGLMCSYTSCLNDQSSTAFKDEAVAVAIDYTNSEKQRLLQLNAGKQVSKPID